MLLKLEKNDFSSVIKFELARKLKSTEIEIKISVTKNFFFNFIEIFSKKIKLYIIKININ